MLRCGQGGKSTPSHRIKNTPCSMSIPLITHQIWMQGFENIPDKFKSNVANLHSLNPEYEHKQWDEKGLRAECAQYSEECAKRFDTLPTMIMKVDFGRYVVLYSYGGISIDTDMVPLRSLKETPGINENDFIISMSAFPLNIVGYVNNAVILTTPHNALMGEIIESIIADTRTCDAFVTDFMCVQEMTGPKRVHEIIKASGKPYKILNNTYYEPCYTHDIGCSTDSKSIMDHKHEGSWVSPVFKYIVIWVFVLFRISPLLLLAGFIYVYRQNPRVGTLKGIQSMLFSKG
jgi:mannosyltransferase OCH1-like enzyme